MIRIRAIGLLVLSTFLASCGGGSPSNATPAPSPPPTPPPPTTGPPDLTTEVAFAQIRFDDPVALKQAPGNSSAWYVVEQGGLIRVFDNDAAVTTSRVFLDISSNLDSGFSESGLLGLAFHPDYPTTPSAYVSYTASSAPLVSRIARFDLNGAGTALASASEVVLLEIEQPLGNHNGGDLAFGPDGYLYGGFGDGGGAGDPGENGQDTTNLLSTIVRIDVDGASPYAIPGTNPFSGNALCNAGPTGNDCPEIFAWGLRNPWRLSFDSLTGGLWTGDVGQNAWEEIDRIERGGNYGWNDREGAHCFDPATGCLDSFDEPVAEYDHSVGQSVTGGYVYRGTAIADLSGWYVFADYVSGVLLAMEADSQPTVAPEQVGDAGFNVAAMAEDEDGEIYLLNYVAGTIHRLIEG